MIPRISSNPKTRRALALLALHLEGQFDWRNWESSSKGFRNRSRRTVDSAVMVRHSSGSFKVEGIILAPDVNYGKCEMVQSWSEVGITEHVVLMLEGGRSVRGNRASIFKALFLRAIIERFQLPSA